MLNDGDIGEKFAANWRSNLAIRRLEPGKKAFLMDLQSLLCNGFPAGYCADLDRPKLMQSQDAGMLKGIPRRNVAKMPNDEIKWQLANKVSVKRQLAVAKSLEPHLSEYIGGYTQEQIAQYLQALLDEGIIVRDADGFICDRFLVNLYRGWLIDNKVRWNEKFRRFRRRTQPLRVAAKKKVRTGNEGTHGSLYKSNASTTNRETGQPLNPVAMPSKGHTSEVGEVKVYSGAAEEIPAFDLKDIYLGGYEAARKKWKFLREQDYGGWHRFVSYLIAQPDYHEVFIAQMVTPPDFAKIVAEKGFTPDKWDAVIQKMLVTGIQPFHKLYFRLPDFIGYANEEEKRSKGYHHAFSKGV